MTRRSEHWLEVELEQLRQQHLWRNLVPRPAAGGKFTDETGRVVLNFSSNDYLNLAHRGSVVAASQRALEQAGCGGGASRLMSGTLPMHGELEASVAVHKGYPAALVFGSGFLTNVGVIPALVGRDDTVYADKLVHASILDGIHLSRAALVRFRHNDAGHLRQLLARHKTGGGGRILVVTESVFSMDGDLAPLGELAEICASHDAMLMVDEAHATGVFGAHGAGLARELGVEAAVNVAMGTFSKALGNYGGFVACSLALRDWLINRSRGFIFTTSLPPAVVGGCLEALRILAVEPELGVELRRRSEWLRTELRAAGLATGRSASQIVPIMIGDSERALRLAARLGGQGVLALAVRPPTVPLGTARLRLSVTLAHTPSDLEQAVQVIVDSARAEGIT